jgi:hypothetical protein
MAWRRDGVCSDRGGSCPLSPGGVSDACMPWSEHAYFVELGPSPSVPGVGSEERSCGAGQCMVKGEVVADSLPGTLPRPS